ncbi:hypothetical protein C8N35_1161, partial [Breoghania corrubedonensis]
IESGKKEGSLRSLQKIATALGVSLEMLLPRADDDEPIDPSEIGEFEVIAEDEAPSRE